MRGERFLVTAAFWTCGDCCRYKQVHCFSPDVIWYASCHPCLSSYILICTLVQACQIRGRVSHLQPSTCSPRHAYLLPLQRLLIHSINLQLLLRIPNKNSPCANFRTKHSGTNMASWHWNLFTLQSADDHQWLFFCTIQCLLLAQTRICACHCTQESVSSMQHALLSV